MIEGPGRRVKLLGCPFRCLRFAAIPGERVRRALCRASDAGPSLCMSHEPPPVKAISEDFSEISRLFDGAGPYKGRQPLQTPTP